jgi:putative hydrolase of the HAD superfamily
MSIDTLMIDLDDTLYPPSTGVWGLIGERIDLFMQERVGLPAERITALRTELFHTYGTTMRGLQITQNIDIDDYLAFVHDVPVETLIRPAPELRALLSRYPQRKVIFTNADSNHARRVLRALQLEDLFDLIIDIHAIAPACKPMPAAFQTALRLLGEDDPARVLFADDTVRNLVAARQLGMVTVLVRPGEPHPEVDFTIPTLLALASILPPDGHREDAHV